MLLAGCKPAVTPPTPRVKRVVHVQPMTTKFIELEDGARYGMGENLYNRLVTKLKNDGRFVVLVDESGMESENAVGLVATKKKAASEPEIDPSDRLHFQFAPIAAAEFAASVEGLTFGHGTRALRTFAGFRKDYRTAWNSGALDSRTEFPPRSLELQTSWFGTTFDPLGSKDTGTIAGVDAGAEGEMNLIIAKIHYRRDQYRASAQIDSQIRLFAEDVVRIRPIEAEGRGYLFALGVGFMALSVEFTIAKRDALKKTFDMSADKLSEAIAEELGAIPFRTRVEEVGAEGIVINAGRREGIAVGDRFEIEREGAINSVEVTEAFHIGSIVKVIAGPGDIAKGEVAVLREEKVNPDMAPVKKLAQAKGVRGLAAVNSTQELALAPKKITFDPPEFSNPNGDAKNALSLKSTILLPYLLSRYAQYDQDVTANPRLEARANLLAKARASAHLAGIRLADAWQTYFPQGTGLGTGVRIAVIDSGVDYNHRNLAHAFDRASVGFDYFGFDERPFDDNSHGTAIAGIIAGQGVRDEPTGIAPDARLLSFRVFNPYGETSSAHLYGAFERAIQSGARIIVAAWDTQRDSKAIEAAIALAGRHGVLVIAAAGDRGADLTRLPSFPAAYAGDRSHVITVAALGADKNLLRLTGRFSNYGVGIVDIAAPGDKLRVLAPRSEYLERAGSDIAAAHVAGAAALVLARNPAQTAADVKRAVLDGAQRSPALSTAVTEGRTLDLPGALGSIR